MKVQKTIALPDNCVYLEKLAGLSFAGITTKACLQQFSTQQEEVTNSATSNLKITLENDPAKIAVDGSASLLIYCNAAFKSAKVYNLRHNQELFGISWHKGAVKSIAMNQRGTLAATGGQDGKVCVWNIKSGKLMQSLMPHKDFVTSISFSHNGRYIASGSYDKAVHLKDIEFNKKMKVLQGVHTGYIKFTRFLHNNRLLSVDAEGVVALWDVTKGTLIAKLPSVPSEPLNFTFAMQESFLLVAAKNKAVYLYNMETLTLEHSIINMQKLPTQCLYLDEEQLFIVATEEKELLVYDFKKEIQRYRDLIQNYHFTQAEEMLETNPMFQKTDAYGSFQKRWNKVAELAFKYLEEEESQKVESLFRPYRAVPKYASYINNIYTEFRNYPQFKLMAEQKKFSMVYNLAEQYPSLKETSTYKIIEKTWKIKLEKAKEGLISKKATPLQINKYLFDYKGIPYKAYIISTMLKNSYQIEQFRNKFNGKYYANCFQMALQHPFLQELREYDMLEKISDDMYHKMLDSFTKGKYMLAKIYAEKLIFQSKYADEANEMLKNTSRFIEFNRYCKEKKYDEMLRLVEIMPLLEDTQEYKEFIFQYQKQVVAAENALMQGSLSEMFTLMQEYIDIDYLAEKIGLMLSVHYIYKIKNLGLQPQNNHGKILKEIEKYVSIFGQDGNLFLLLDSLESEFGIVIERTNLEKKAANYTHWKKMGVLRQELLAAS